MIGSLIWLVSGFALALLPGFASGILPGVQSSALGRLPAGILSFLYRVLEQIVSLASGAPGFASPGWVPVLLVSLLVFSLLWFLERRRRIAAGRLIPLF
jgi:hypothetical protein